VPGKGEKEGCYLNGHVEGGALRKDDKGEEREGQFFHGPVLPSSPARIETGSPLPSDAAERAGIEG